jgi:hypothetical protein
MGVAEANARGQVRTFVKSIVGYGVRMVVIVGDVFLFLWFLLSGELVYRGKILVRVYTTWKSSRPADKGTKDDTRG